MLIPTRVLPFAGCVLLLPMAASRLAAAPVPTQEVRQAHQGLVHALNQYAEQQRGLRLQAARAPGAERPRAAPERLDALAAEVEQFVDPAYQVVPGGGQPLGFAALRARALPLRALAPATAPASPVSWEIETRIRRIEMASDGTAAAYVEGTAAFIAPGGKRRRDLMDSRGREHRASGRWKETWRKSEESGGRWRILQTAPWEPPTLEMRMGGPGMAPMGAVACDPDYWYDYHVGLDQNPIGYTLHAGRLRVRNLIPLRPSGFPADQHRSFPAPSYGFGQGWEGTVAATGAQALGPPGEAIFYGIGAQKQFLVERDVVPASAIGGMLYTGPHHHHGEMLYVVSSKRVTGDPDRGKRLLFLHGGLKLEAFHADRSSTGLRPFAGVNYAVSRRLGLRAEWSYRQPWERATPYSAGITFHPRGLFRISGGIRNNGYRTLPFIKITP